MWSLHPYPKNANNSRWGDLPLFDGVTVVNPKLTMEDQKNFTTWYTERAVKFIEKNKDKPFFIYLPHTMPHVPLAVSDKFEGKSGKGLYGDVVMEIDWSIGVILKTLKENNLDQKTFLLVSSDNGPFLSLGNHAGSAAPLREGKFTCWEGGARVPTIAWFPGMIPAGTTCTELASTIDILPTVAAMTGAELPKQKIDGKDIRPLLYGEPNAKSPHTAFPLYFQDTLCAIRDTRWKLVLPHSYRSLNGRPGGKDGVPAQYEQVRTELALYDLENDVSETTDVKDKYPAITRRLQKAADEIIAELGNGKQKGPGVRPAAQF